MKRTLIMSMIAGTVALLVGSAYDQGVAADPVPMVQYETCQVDDDQAVVEGTCFENEAPNLHNEAPNLDPRFESMVANHPDAEEVDIRYTVRVKADGCCEVCTTVCWGGSGTICWRSCRTNCGALMPGC